MHDHRSRVVAPQVVVVYAYAFLVLSALSYAVYVTPLNVNDLLKHLFLFETQTIPETFYSEFFKLPGAGEWRPLQLPIAQIIYVLFAQGHEHLVFKGMLIGFLFLIGWLFLKLLAIRAWTDVLAAVIALLVLVGHHSFGGAVEGVYPFGVEIILLALQFSILIILLRTRPSLGSEILAVAIATFAIILNEKGGFVGVTYIVGSLLRLPGGTLRSAAIIFAASLAVVCAHLWITPPHSLVGRSEARGYLGVLIDTIAPVLNILISDPRLGQFSTIPQAIRGAPWAILYLTSSVALSALIVAWAWSAWKRPDDATRQELKVAATFLVVLVAGTIFGPFSRKDYLPIMALAGYSVVSFYALRWFFAETLQLKRLAVYSLLVTLAAGLALSWSIRAAGLIYYMRQVSFLHQFEWAFNTDWLGRTRKFDPQMTHAIIARMRPEGLSPPLNHPHLVFPRLVTHFMRGRDCPEACAKPAK